MKKEYVILFTCVGRRVELVQLFKQAGEDLGIQLTIVGVDNSPLAPAQYFCDSVEQICKISDNKYIKSIEKIALSYHVNLIIPTIDTDLLKLSCAKQQFEEKGIKVLISAFDKIQICRDKRNTYNFFKSCGLDSPLTIDNIRNYHGPFPCFVKPKDGSSSINAFKVNSQTELQTIVERVPDYIIQNYVEGEEYTVDILCDYQGKLLGMSPRIRQVVRGGEVLITSLRYDVKIEEECKKIINKFNPCGPLTVQLIRTLDCTDYFIEINPRFGGGVPLTMKGGVNFAKAILSSLLNFKYKIHKHSHNITLSRFDQSIIVPNGKITEFSRFDSTFIEMVKSYKVILFDLDDTLYDEIDYVRSGFKAICNDFSELKDGYLLLEKAFLEGKKPINTLLESKDLFNKEYLDKVISTYRSHKPSIILHEGVKEVLTLLKARGFKLGLITDGRPEGQNNKIKSLALSPYFQEIIITDELAGNVGDPLQFRKPHSISFSIMRQRFNVDYSEMVYIGDNEGKDFKAPQKLGMQCLKFINPKGLYQNR